MSKAVEFGTPGGMAAEHDRCEPCHTRGPVVMCECRYRFCLVCFVVHTRSTGHRKEGWA